ncbi:MULTISPECIES: LysR family transcriptional regulator [Pandoraea]|uniref:LysR family transcriptional regulator n=1 Tax=Pandoraea TaxID=93217 RepID=UPI001F5C12EF|nr:MULTISPECIES: LysR family transcriptional regulator [Pandoraea]MCI3208630.1 LysR family transcriptional regulator [Pandoraea sp. LA3]MDN4586659.1 LysR family transcriptional regulator [Pandoraea capi]
MKLENRTQGEGTFNYRSLRYLREIEVHGGVRAAADALSINASVISRQVAALERQLGVVLLEHVGRKVVLSTIGANLAQHYVDGSRRDAEMFAQLDDYRGLRRGRVGIAIGEGWIETILADVLKSFSLEFPNIVVDLRSGAKDQIVAMVRNDEVEIGLCGGVGNDAFIRAKSFRTAKFCAMVSPDHTLARHKSIRFRQLLDERLIFMPAQFGIQQHIDAIIQTERISVTPAYYCDLFSSAQALAAAGLGVAFMSPQTARRNIEAGRLVALEVDHPIARQFSSQVIRRVGRRFSPAAESLWKKLLKAIHQA